MQTTPLSCPNCGAGLGPMQAGQFLCAYCGHRSLPPRPVVDPRQHAAALAAALSQFDARRARALSAVQELRQRSRDAKAQQRRSNGFVLLGIGGLFLAFAAGCAGLAVFAALSAGPAPVASVVIFGLFWLALGGGMFYGGIRYMSAGRRAGRLRATGLRGRATITSYRQSHLVLDGNPKFDLVLQVDLPGVAPYLVKQSEWVENPSAVTTGAELPVFVNPANQADVLIDWFAA